MSTQQEESTAPVAEEGQEQAPYGQQSQGGGCCSGGGCPSQQEEGKAAKKKKKKKKKKNGMSAEEAAEGEETQLEQKELLTALYDYEKKPSAQQKEHKFWKTQPVPQHGEQPTDHGPIQVGVLDEVPKEGLALPKGFEWDAVDMTDAKQNTEVYELLRDNYVEDDGAMFRFEYAKEFLAWALLAPGYDMQLHVGVRVTATRKLVGFITGIPVEVRVYKNDLNVVEINFLCVHKKLRSKRLAPVLIKEVTRRTHLRDEWQAVYTAGVVLPKPVAANQYWHRSLNPKKLIEIGFSRLRPRMTMNQTIKLFKLPATPDIAGMRLMEEKDHVQCHAMLVKYLQKFDLTQVYSLAEFKHWFSPRPNVIWTYVVEDPESKQITDFASFYNLPSTVLGNSRHDTLRAAYSYYNVAVKTPLEDLVRNVMVCARNEGMDVFNCLDLMDNKEFLKPLKFGAGDGNLQYYLYNWRCPEIASEKVGLVLL